MLGALGGGGRVLGVAADAVDLLAHALDRAGGLGDLGGLLGRAARHARRGIAQLRHRLVAAHQLAVDRAHQLLPRFHHLVEGVGDVAEGALADPGARGEVAVGGRGHHFEQSEDVGLQLAVLGLDPGLRRADRAHKAIEDVADERGGDDRRDDAEQAGLAHAIGAHPAQPVELWPDHCVQVAHRFDRSDRFARGGDRPWRASGEDALAQAGGEGAQAGGGGGELGLDRGAQRAVATLLIVLQRRFEVDIDEIIGGGVDQPAETGEVDALVVADRAVAQRAGRAGAGGGRQFAQHRQLHHKGVHHPVAVEIGVEDEVRIIARLVEDQFGRQQRSKPGVGRIAFGRFGDAAQRRPLRTHLFPGLAGIEIRSVPGFDLIASNHRCFDGPAGVQLLAARGSVVGQPQQAVAFDEGEQAMRRGDVGDALPFLVAEIDVLRGLLVEQQGDIDVGDQQQQQQQRARETHPFDEPGHRREAGAYQSGSRGGMGGVVGARRHGVVSGTEGGESGGESRGGDQ